MRSVAVPFSNCIEPSNVKAGGKACPIRFQCAGSGFYRPDPSYIPAIEEHIGNSLTADREIASAMNAASFVIDNLNAQIDAFRNVLQVMRGALERLDAEHREVEKASAVLRKARAGAGLPLEDISRRKESP